MARGSETLNIRKLKDHRSHLRGSLHRVKHYLHKTLEVSVFTFWRIFQLINISLLIKTGSSRDSYSPDCHPYNFEKKRYDRLQVSLVLASWLTSYMLQNLTGMLHNYECGLRLSFTCHQAKWRSEQRIILGKGQVSKRSSSHRSECSWEHNRVLCVSPHSSYQKI